MQSSWPSLSFTWVRRAAPTSRRVLSRPARSLNAPTAAPFPPCVSFPPKTWASGPPFRGSREGSRKTQIEKHPMSSWDPRDSSRVDFAKKEGPLLDLPRQHANEDSGKPQAKFSFFKMEIFCGKWKCPKIELNFSNR